MFQNRKKEKVSKQAKEGNVGSPCLPPSLKSNEATTKKKEKIKHITVNSEAENYLIQEGRHMMISPTASL